MRDALTDEFAQAWGRRVPAPVLVLGPGVVLLLTIVLAWDDLSEGQSSIDDLTSWGYALGQLAFGAILVLLLGVLRSPRLTGWLVLALISPPVLGPTVSGPARLMWVPWAAVLVLDLSYRWRQHELFSARYRALSRPTRPRLPAYPLNEPFRAVVSVILVVGCVGLVGSWVTVRDDLRAADDRSVTVRATVVAQDDGWVEIDLDGRTWEVYVDDAERLEPGDEYPVHVDPTGRFGPWTDDDVDPGYSSARIDGAGLLLGMMLLTMVLPRLRRRAVMRSAEEPAVTCLVQPGPARAVSSSGRWGMTRRFAQRREPGGRWRGSPRPGTRKVDRRRTTTASLDGSSAWSSRSSCRSSRSTTRRGFALRTPGSTFLRGPGPPGSAG